MSVKNYERAIIEGQLQCLAELSVGSGETGKYEDKRKDKQELREYLQICTSHDGKPYLPATSLRGLLSDLCRQLKPDEHLALFGNARDDEGQIGALRAYDATWQSTPPAKDYAIHERLGRQADAKTVLRQRAAIDPVTGTAADQKLFTVAAVPAGSIFNCHFELDRVGEAELASLFGLLERLDGNNPQSRLGKGANRQAGRVKWISQTAKLRVLSQVDLVAWLQDGAANSPLKFTQIKPPPQSKDYSVSVRRFIRIPFKLHSDGPLLVDPVQVPSKKDEDENSTEPDMVFRRGLNGQLLLPAASLRGPLRSHCRKILMTLLVHQMPDEQPPYMKAKDIADGLIQILFGHTGKRSAIILSDAVTQQSATHPQTFNAIDRFTGGVAKGALYSVEAATTTELNGELLIETRLLPDRRRWCFGLLALALRDGMEGDFALGWGKAKGYGAVRVSLSSPHVEGEARGVGSGIVGMGNILPTGETAPLSDWSAVMNLHGVSIKRRVNALHNKLAQRIQEAANKTGAKP